jgi:hypothetical protein
LQLQLQQLRQDEKPSYLSPLVGFDLQVNGRFRTKVQQLESRIGYTKKR